MSNGRRSGTPALSSRELERETLERENEQLRARLAEVEDEVRAIRAGDADALVIAGEREAVYTLERPDNPYRLVVAQVPQPAATLTTDGAVISVNSRFADLLQRPPAALYRRPLSECVAPAARDALDALLSTGAREEVRGEVTLQRDDGSETSVFLSCRPLHEGAFGLCLMVTDLTEQHRHEELQRAQAALRESESRLESDLAAAQRLQDISTRLIQQGDVARLYHEILDAALEILHADCASMHLLDTGASSLRLLVNRGFDDALVSAFSDLALDGSSVCALAWNDRRRIVAGDLHGFERLTGSRARDALLEGGLRAMQSTPLVSRSGQILGMISTHWRSPHEPVERDLGLLDVLARQAADLIERTRDEEALREASRLKDEFLATLAHELRNPLAPIRTGVEILKASGPLNPELAWACEVIDRQAHVMSRLLDDLLDVSRIALDRPQLRKQVGELSRIVPAAVETARPLVERARHELSVTLPDEPVYLQADPVRLAQVFGNLLNNAAKYTDEGGRIQLRAERHEDEVVVTVRDTGIGIAAELLPHVYDLFSQAAPKHGGAQAGLGIGLSLVKGLVELHGGRVEARSAGVGAGSEFVVRLPALAPSESGTTTVPEQGRASSSQKRRILVVDDHPDNADSLTLLLQAMGHEVQKAYDGQRAIELAEAFRPELMLLDIGMIGVDGHEVCRHIREQPWGQETFIAALTGWGQEEDRRRTESSGFDRHLVKPVTTEQLKELVAAMPSRASGPGLPG